MPDLVPFRSRSELDAERNLGEFIRYAQDELTWLADREGFCWEGAEWPGARWVKIAVGKRRHFSDEERLDPMFIDFAKAYCRHKNTENETRTKWEIAALKCLEAALLTVTGSGSVQGLSWTVLDEADAVARKHFTAQPAYHVGRNIRDIAQFVSIRRLVPVDISTWRSTLQRPSSVRRIGPAAQAESDRKLPSEAGMHATAEIFANNPVDQQARFATAVWALLLSAEWRISELLRLHVNAEHEEPDDDGVVSYGLRYYGAKGWEYDIKWIPKVFEPVAREAFRRIKEMTDSSRALARHLETTPDAPFLYPDTPDVGIDDELTVDEKAVYLGRAVPKGRGVANLSWRFRSIREHWLEASSGRPDGFPLFATETGLKWSDALFCMHLDCLHETRPTDRYRLFRPTTNTVNDLLRPTGIKKGVLQKLGYTEPDGRPIRLTTHMARHFVGTIAERGEMAEEDRARWAGRATPKDNRVYNHMSEDERAERDRRLLEPLPPLVAQYPRRRRHCAASEVDD